MSDLSALIAAPTGPASRSELVAAAIREEILQGLVPPGARLGFAELCRRHGASVGVVREALVRLVSGGLVAAENNQGFTVRTLSLGGLAELMMLRRLCEPPLVRQSVIEGSVEWESLVLAELHLLQRAVESAAGHASHPGAVWEAHTRFHLALAAGTGSPRVQEMLRRMSDETDLYRRWARPARTGSAPSERAGEDDADGSAPRSEGGWRRFVARHRLLAEEALARDATRAAATLRELIEDTNDHLVSELARSDDGRTP